MKKLININLIFGFLSFLIVSCSSSHEDSKKSTSSFSGNVMTIDYRIIVGTKLLPYQKQNIQNLIEQTFAEVDNFYNKWNPASELSRLNQLKKGISVNISEKLETLLQQTEQIVKLTNGRFDPTIEPVQRLWKNNLNKGKTPSDTKIAKAMQAVGYDKIHIENGIFYKDHDETSLDLGGIAKGYAVDLLVARLNEIGFPNVFVEWGGEIKATGSHPENRPWHIFIAKLNNSDPESAIAHLDLKNKSIATSGDYLQNWTVNERINEIDKSKTYFHVIDPKTGYPLEIKNNSIASVSVVANQCLVADAVATALMLFPDAGEAVEFAEKVKLVYPEIEFWIVTRDD